MNWLSELAVGDMVFIVPSDRRFNKPHHARVEKKGRDYVYFLKVYEDGMVSRSADIKASMKNIGRPRTSVNVGSGAFIYRDENEYKDALAVSVMSRKIQDAFRYARMPTDDQIRQIAAILNISGDPDE